MKRYDARTLKRLREARGMTILETARKAGITPRALYSLEDGSAEPKAGTLARLSRALGVEVDEFFAGKAS